MIRHDKTHVVAAALILAFAGGQAAAQNEPAALVEEIEADGAGIEAMEFVVAGQTISLGRRGRLVLGYLRSCIQEQVTGGRVVVGTTQSTVESGTVDRKKVDCDGGQIQLSVEQAQKSAVVAFRRGLATDTERPRPRVTVFSTQPIIRVGGSEPTLSIERIDASSPVVTVEIQWGLADVSRSGAALAPGGIYRVVAGSREIVFKIDSFARPAGPAISRLILLP